MEAIAIGCAFIVGVMVGWLVGDSRGWAEGYNSGILGSERTRLMYENQTEALRKSYRQQMAAVRQKIADGARPKEGRFSHLGDLSD